MKDYDSMDDIDRIFKKFNIAAKLDGISENALYTQYEILIDPGQSVQGVLNCKSEISVALKNEVLFSIPVSNKSRLGILVPKEERTITDIMPLINDKVFQQSKGTINFVVGTDMQGKIVVDDLATMPNLLVAGTTGSGKSVFIDCMLASLLSKYTADQLKLVLIDTRGANFDIYEDVPHLMVPVINTTEDCLDEFETLLSEADRRYKLLAKMKVRSAESYNRLVSKNPSLGAPMVPVVVIVDDITDLMRHTEKEMTDYTVRMTMKLRAAGMHLVYVTQRPDTKTLTPNIKRNMMGCVGFKVTSREESHMIFDDGNDDNGDASQLLGYGDMYFKRPGYYSKKHLVGAYISEEEIRKVVETAKKNSRS